MFVNQNIKQYLNQIESSQPTPGGGSASSLAANLGAALTLMTSNFSLEKKYFKELNPDIQEKVKMAHLNIKEMTHEFSRLMDEDAEGFKLVIQVYNEDIKCQNEKKIKLEKSYRKALIAPFKCSIKCLELLELQEIIVKYGNHDTITDVGIGVILTFAALEGSIMSVIINLNNIEDDKYKSKILGELNDIYVESLMIYKSLREKIDKILLSEGNLK